MEVVAKYIPEEDYTMIAFESDEVSLKKDETKKISSQITPISQSEMLVYWESEDNSVAIVSDQGVITAVGSGETTIVATVSETGEKANCKVRVLGGQNNSNVEPTQTPESGGQPTETPINTPDSNRSFENAQASSRTPQNITDENTGIENGKGVPKVKINKIKISGKYKLKATWKKLTNVSGYQIQYATNKKFKKAKSKTVKSTSVTLKKLKKKKTYFVRVRAYILANGKKVYGKWSSVKKVKIKK